MTPRKKTKATTVQILPLKIAEMKLRIVGDSPLICHAFDQKSEQQILDKQKGLTRVIEKKDPDECFRRSLYPIDEAKGIYGFPARGFKAAAVSACTFIEGVTKVETRGAFFVIPDYGDLVRIGGSKPRAVAHRVKIGMGTTDVRIRGQFDQWEATLRIQYDTGNATPDQIVNLFNRAGFSIGVGEWRPERGGAGINGRFHVELGKS